MAQIFLPEAITARQVLAIEDTATGVQAALAAGCQVILWQDPTNPVSIEREPNLFIVDSAEQVMGIIRVLSSLSPRQSCARRLAT